MLKKIKDFFRDMIYSPSGTATLVLLVMILISASNFINRGLLFSDNRLIIPMLAISYLSPFLLFKATHGGRKYKINVNLKLPKRYHIPTIFFSILLLCFGSTLLKLAFVNVKYVELPLYNAFFAHRNGKLMIDLYLVLVFCVLTPILEGLIFRGAILKEHEKMSRMTISVFSAFMFALLSLNFGLFLPNFFVGIILCLVVYATESLTTAVAVHITYNFFAVFIEPTFVSVKSVSSNYELFAFLVAICTLIVAILLLSHLSRLYRKYSHDKFGKNTVRSTPPSRALWQLAELLTTIPAIACYILFFVITIMLRK